jgi:hypothetical protein
VGLSISLNDRGASVAHFHQCPTSGRAASYFSLQARVVYFLISPDLYVIRSSDNISSDDDGLLTIENTSVYTTCPRNGLPLRAKFEKCKNHAVKI